MMCDQITDGDYAYSLMQAKQPAAERIRKHVQDCPVCWSRFELPRAEPDVVLRTPYPAVKSTLVFVAHSPRPERAQNATPARQRVSPERALEVLELLLPRRVNNESLGDARELLSRVKARGENLRCQWILVGTTWFWLLFDSLVYVLDGLRRKAK